MKFPASRDMFAALTATRAGHLGAATQHIQRALRAPNEAAQIKTVTPPQPGVDARNVGALVAPRLPKHTQPIDQKAPSGDRFVQIGANVAAVDCIQSNGNFSTRSFTSAAGTRRYKLYLPRDYAMTACPLLVMLHGCTQSADDFAAGTRMNDLADEFTFIVAYPEQPVSANSSKCWNWFHRRDQHRDRGEPSIVAGITRQIMHDFVIDRERVYVAGMSAGAAAAAVLAATYPDLYAGIGVHSGLACGLAHDVPSAFAAMRNASRPDPTGAEQRTLSAQTMPTIVFHGDADTTVHPANAERFNSMLPVTSLAKQTLTGHVPGGRAYTQTTYMTADRHPMYEQWIVHGAGHAWSGGSPLGSFTDPPGPDASREMVRFLLLQHHSG